MTDCHCFYKFCIWNFYLQKRFDTKCVNLMTVSPHIWLSWRKNESISLKITCISFVCLWYCPLETTLVNYYGHALSENITDPTIISPAQWVQLNFEKTFLFSCNFMRFLSSFSVLELLCCKKWQKKYLSRNWFVE